MYFVQGPWSDTCVEVHVNEVHFLCICTFVSFHAKSDQMTVTNDKEKQVVVEILNRKMEAVHRKHAKNQFEYDLASAQAVSSMYGVELLPDNVETCQNRLFDQYLETYRQHQAAGPSTDLERCIRFLLHKNILCGDALTMLQQDGTPITFCEWTFIGTGGKVKRRDFELAELLRNVEYDKPKAGEEGLLFADTGEPTFVHLPKREYPIADYLKLPDYE